MDKSDDVLDPLRFGEEEDDLQDEVPLHDDPLPMQPDPLEDNVASTLVKQDDDPATQAATAAAAPSATHAAQSLGQDPLTTASRTDAASSGLGSSQGAPPAGSSSSASASASAAPSTNKPTTSTTAAAAGGGGGGLSAGRGLIPRSPSSEINEDARWLRGAAGEAPRPMLRITVTDPVKRMSDSLIPGVKGGHYEYLVTTVADNPRRRIEARRRFNDFVALADLLAHTHRGYFVFPRPDKNSLEGQMQMGKKDFIETRRSDLERYLTKLAEHPVVGRSDELKVFLEAEGALSSCFAWHQLQPMKGGLLEGVARLPRQLLGSDSSVPSTTEAAQNAKNTSDLLRRFREMGERMRQEYKAPPHLSEEEAKLRGDRTVTEEYLEKVSVASRKAEKVVQEFEELGAVVGDLGLALIKVAKFEDETGVACGQYSDWGAAAKTVAADCRRVGMSSVRLSRLSRAATSQVMDTLEPLHNELALTPAVGKALREREAALLTVQCIEEDMERKKQALVQLEGSGSQGARKVATLHNDVAGLEAALASAKSEYERVKARNKEELERWRGEKAEGYFLMGRSFAQVNSLFEERCSQVWRGVAEDFGAGQQLEQTLKSRKG